MKFTLPFLKKGDLVQAKVIEILPDRACIVSFNGDLVRVKNSSGRIFSAGDTVKLKVTHLDPLSFQIPTSSNRHLDRQV